MIKRSGCNLIEYSNHHLKISESLWQYYWDERNAVLTENTSWFNCEINFILTWSADCVTSAGTGATQSPITDTIFNVSVQIYQLLIMENYCNILHGF